MNEARAIARCEEAAALLPPRFRRAALQMPDHRKRYTEEFRLRAGQPPRRTAARGRGHAAVLRRGQPRDAARSRADGGRGDGLLALCLRGDAAAGLSVPARRLPARRMRNGGAAERRGRKPAGYFLALAAHRHRADRPGRADGRQPVLRGSLPEHAPALAAGRRQDDASARPHPHALARKREPRGAARRGGGRARRDCCLRRRRGADGIGDAHGRAHALPQGAGHRHGAAGDEPAGHRGR